MRYLIGCLFITVLNLASETGFPQTVNFTSSNLPIIVINTNGQEIADDPKITVDMGIIFNGNGIRNNLTDAFNHYNGKIGIEIRGKSSQMFPMKSYAIELWDEAGESQDKSLLGMPKESDWVLYAPYTDKTLMRNVLAYQTAAWISAWAPRTRYVELVLNGDYRGVYVLLEKIKRGKDRVNIPKMSETDSEGDAVTGGYIVAIDKKDPDDEGWWSPYPSANNTRTPAIEFIYNYPKTEDITTAQRVYLQKFIDSFESALKGRNFQDPVAGFRKFANDTSFINYFFVNEISRNVDAYRLSTFLYKKRQSSGGKLYAGPVWDYDLAYRNADYCNGSSISGWAYNFNYDCPGDYWQVPFWWERLTFDSAYVTLMRSRWSELRLNLFHENSLNHFIDSVANLLNEAQQRHFTRWQILGQYIWPNPQPIPTSYEEEISTLKTWLFQRLSWMDSNMPQILHYIDWPSGNNNTMLILVQPNPLTAGGRIIIRSTTSQAASVQIADAMGRVIRSLKVSLQQGDNDISQLAGYLSWPHGVYSIRVYNDRGEKVTKKLVRH